MRRFRVSLKSPGSLLASVLSWECRFPLEATQHIPYHDGTAKHNPWILIYLFDQISRMFDSLQCFIHCILNSIDDIINCRFCLFYCLLNLLYILHDVIYGGFCALHRFMDTLFDHFDLFSHRGPCFFYVFSNVAFSLIHLTFSFIVSTVRGGTTSIRAILFLPK